MSITPAVDQPCHGAFAGAGHDVSIPGFEHLWNGFTRGFDVPSEPCVRV